ncbi:hypothetical protein BT93_L5110 [Corymbia citriodora subsp. variegata]|uniref:Uncharacterized protein n=1 Tax=Corymbia citriodora subsp. variegata TaxID=360336 RepID=A0A8T0CSP9_CORYI|nr:hypothetical protein BT93_L5110 [Corymbia citriodora subsp. variegata]
MACDELLQRSHAVEPRERGESFRGRWIMFVSILAQKLLLLVAKPMSWIGWAVEFWLNLLSSNQNLGGLPVNCLRGNHRSKNVRKRADTIRGESACEM